MWKSIPSATRRGWQRYWFANELNSSAGLNVRGLGLREPMFNRNVDRPIGTGDWLIMFFHSPPRLSRSDPKPTAKANSLMLWPPGTPQFYSWGRAANVERHSWMHVEGTCVSRQIKEYRLPTSTPLLLESDTQFTETIQSLISEMTRYESPDPVILQNLFQNWAIATARELRTKDTRAPIPPAMLRIRAWLDEHFTTSPELDQLAGIVDLSRSYVCHQFREQFGTTISDYVIQKRMSIAQRLLFDLSLRVGDIAAQVGYSDIFQFSKQFKKSFGVSPSEYRLQSARQATANECDQGIR